MFSVLLVQQRMNIISCLIVRHIVPSGTSFTNIFWGPAPTLSSFLTLHDPKVIARFF